ncbi:MAG: thiamine diphosphokinase [Parachlamydia sp.]|nr:thiamine diphosphokinase [Parachlamydia sp.]
MFHTVAVVANGAIHDYSITASLIKAYNSVIAVDGGLHHCSKMHILPDMLYGDLDSVSQELLNEYPELPVRRFHVEKDETDLELTLQSIFTPEVDKITVFGALEKRLDHTLANLHLIRRYPEKVFLENESEILFAFHGSIEIPCREGQTISFIPIGDDPTGVSSEGLKWEMHDATFSKYFFSLSNICLRDKVKISVGSGDLICSLQK